MFGIPEPWWSVVRAVVWALFIIIFLAVNAIVAVWLERKVSGKIQRRIGPQRVGRPIGWAQTIADVFKLLVKEDVRAEATDKWVFLLAPAIPFAAITLMFLVVPWGKNLIPLNLNIGLLFVVAVTSFEVLGLFMAGWGSNNKWALLGAMRTAAAMISYELPMVLAILAVGMTAGSLNMNDVVNAQSRVPFILIQPVAFLIYYIASLAEANRTPFDFTEAESELVAGANIEYSGLRWAFFFLAEYGSLVGTSAIAATLFLGGWRGPILPGPVWFLIKTYLLVYVAMWIRWTLPRVRIDQLLDFGWKFLLPLALADIAVTGLVLALL